MCQFILLGEVVNIFCPFFNISLKNIHTLSHSIVIASHYHNQFTYGRKTINASFEEFKGKACAFFLSKCFRQKRLGKLCKKFESLIINFVFCVINTVTIKTLMQQFCWRDKKMLSSCIGCLLIIYYFKYLWKYAVVIWLVTGKVFKTLNDWQWGVSIINEVASGFE